MTILDKHIDFVNEKVEFHKDRANQFSDNPYKKARHTETAELFQSLLDDIKEASALLAIRDGNVKTAQPAKIKLSLTPEDIKGLPPEVIAELSTASLDETEFAILSVMEEAGGIMSLDQIIVGLFHQTGNVHKRSTITNKIYRMDKIHSVTGKKGVYALNTLSDEEIAEMI